MDIAEQKATFHGVIGLFKWGSVGVAASIALLVLWFCTPAGPIPGFVIALLMVILGVAFLREKKAPPAH
jgi:hypothetical protein